MALVQRILSRPHTIAEFRKAASLRYREALRLAVAGDRLAAIYLACYAAEMLLKAGRQPIFDSQARATTIRFIPSPT